MSADTIATPKTSVLDTLARRPGPVAWTRSRAPATLGTPYVKE
jgi:hypothetical protein